MKMGKNNRNCEFYDFSNSDLVKHPFITVFTISFAMAITFSIFNWLLGGLNSFLEDRLVGKMEYAYCDDCSNPQFNTCSYLRYEREDLKNDLCYIKQHNGKYWKILYKSPAFEEYENKVRK